MILKSKKEVFTTKDGAAFDTFEDAKRHELESLFKPGEPWSDGSVLNFLLGNWESLVDILTTGPKSQKKAQADKGTKRKPRAAKETAEGAKV